MHATRNSFAARAMSVVLAADELLVLSWYRSSLADSKDFL